MPLTILLLAEAAQAQGTESSFWPSVILVVVIVILIKTFRNNMREEREKREQARKSPDVLMGSDLISGFVNGFLHKWRR